ncbi:MAG: G8 domain-containing protein [Planctomycetaceae bacterium]|nr:G8 domain-containing protein [Planctomycetaceae bacterium]
MSPSSLRSNCLCDNCVSSLRCLSSATSRTRPVRHLTVALMLGLLSSFDSGATADEPPLVQSRQSGPWSANETWDAGRIPRKGDRVVIRKGHHVGYDVDSREVIRLVQIAGTLEFARDRSTRLEAGLVSVIASEKPSEEGFDCDLDLSHDHHYHGNGNGRPALLVGRPGAPIPVEHTATIRLHYVEGMDKKSCPSLINCGGRLEIHGSPLRRTWVKLMKEAAAGTQTLSLAEPVTDWNEGDHLVITRTQRPGRGGGFRRSGGNGAGRRGESAEESSDHNEERKLVSTGGRDFTGGNSLRLDAPLSFLHYADESEGFQGEVVNLTRNVIVESADPDGVRGHTMFHKNSAGSISYAEFRHLGKQDVLGRYSMHFHLCGDTMRGSSVIGASIWDSHNRWITIHGTDDLVIRDCVGFKSIGHGYFLEDGTETNNILDHNMAIAAKPGKPLPNQVIPFDLNLGAGFWWANCQNSFTRNVAVDCGEYGYRFECIKTENFDPVQAIRQADGTIKRMDTRVMPFVRFEDNEAHSFQQFCLNIRGVPRFGGVGGMPEGNAVLLKEAAEAVPEPGKPFWIRNFRAWEANYSIHLGTTGVFVDGLDSFRNDVAIWRSIMDRSGFRRLNSREMRVNDIHNPISVGQLSLAGQTSRGVSSFRDTMPPTTMITKVVRSGSIVQIFGSVADTSDIKRVTVNGQTARSTRGSFAEWEIVLECPDGKPLEIAAFAEDVNGITESTAHKLVVD